MSAYATEEEKMKQELRTLRAQCKTLKNYARELKA